MVALAKNWTISINNQFSSAVDQAVQYREAVYALIDAFRAAGWTVVRSSNGTVADGSDNIASPSDIVYGISTDPRSWVILSPPAAFLGYAGAWESINVMIAAFENAADTTPQAIELRWVTNGIFTGGTTTANPTAVGGTNSQPGSANLRSTFIGWNAPVAGNWASWVSTQGDVVFGIKQDGQIGWNTWFMACSFQSGEPQLGYGAYRPAIYGVGSSTAGNAASGAALNAATNWSAGGRSFANASLSILQATSYAWNFSQWTLGAENTRGIPASEIFLANNQSSENARFFGRIVDFYGSPQNAPQGEVQDGDADVIRLVNCAGATGGGLWVPVPAADLPIL